MYDFHTHTFLSDGVLSPIELIRRAQVRGYKAIAVTDHVGVGNLEWVVKTLIKDCDQATRRWDILALPGVEITHVPKEDIDMVARTAKELGAKLVTVHGETIVEPVEPGTNEAAVRSVAVALRRAAARKSVLVAAFGSGGCPVRSDLALCKCASQRQRTRIIRYFSYCDCVSIAFTRWRV